MSKLNALADLGQSVWYDYIRRAFIASGELQTLVDQGLRGVTSNPSIFEKAIAGSADYDAALRSLVDAGRSVAEIYEELASADIRAAADILQPVFERSGGADGFVSLEVSPTLAHDTAGTVAEARRLHAALGRPNVLIKVPATAEGIPAITALTEAGISVNVTLIFSVTQYEAVAEAYLAGLEKRAGRGENLSEVNSVASFFVSRVDTAADTALEKIGERILQGTIAVANARAAYARFRALFSGERWERLAARGARVQRPLWASTGTKAPGYPDTLYVDSLIGPDTVNTVPPATLNAFLDHGSAVSTLGDGLPEALSRLARLAELGIDLDAIARTLLDDGVAAFATSFEKLMSSISSKREKLLAERPGLTASLARTSRQSTPPWPRSSETASPPASGRTTTRSGHPSRPISATAWAGCTAPTSCPAAWTGSRLSPTRCGRKASRRRCCWAWAVPAWRPRCSEKPSGCGKATSTSPCSTAPIRMPCAPAPSGST
jgi:transaldolase